LAIRFAYRQSGEGWRRCAAGFGIPRLSDQSFAAQMLLDDLYDSLDAVQNIAIRKSQDAVTSRLEMRRACGVVAFLLLMLRAINFDDQSGVVTAEIREVVIDRHLAAELCSVNLSVAQNLPQFVLGIGRFAPQRPCAADDLVF
jgi:hypothetical protein